MLTIEHPMTGEKLQIANQDFSQSMTWDQAMNAYIELGSGWRLPTKEELEEMYEQFFRKGLGNFKNRNYWSSTRNNARIAWYFEFDHEYGGPSNATSLIVSENKFYVRAVRAL